MKLRRFTAVFLSIAMAGSLCMSAAHGAEGGLQVQAESGVQVVVDGRTLALDPAPVIENDRTLVPLRQIFEALGASVDWNSSARVVTASRGSTTVKLQIDYGSMGHTYKGLAAYEKLDVPPRIIDSRTYVPLRAVSQALGASVDWDSASRTAEINTPSGDVQTLGGEIYAGTSGYLTEGTAKFLMYNTDIKPLMPAEVTGTHKSAGNSFYDGSKTGVPAAEVIIDEILAGIIRPGMSDSEKWKAVYNHLIFDGYKHNDQYYSSRKIAELMPYVHGRDLMGAGGAALEILYTKEGVCDHFAALFTSMMKYMGYDSEVVAGLYVNRDGSEYPHAWSVIHYGGMDYYFDPDIENSLYMRGTQPSYYLFMQTKEECLQNHKFYN